MDTFDRKSHWETIYSTKQLNEVSWYQPTPETSLNFIKALDVPKSASIIDVGGGDSFLVDNLLDLGYTDITVLDISQKAIERAKKRLGERGKNVKWIEADVSKFNPTQTYDLWHDRAAFHFLTDEREIKNYIQSAEKGIKQSGKMIIGAFATDGPTKCSGIEVTQYSEDSLPERFNNQFKTIDCQKLSHRTPFDTIQSFVFCTFQKKQ